MITTLKERHGRQSLGRLWLLFGIDRLIININWHNEYLEGYEVENIVEATELMEKVIQLDKEERPHMSIGNMTPEHLHHITGKQKNFGRVIIQKILSL